MVSDSLCFINAAVKVCVDGGSKYFSIQNSLSGLQASWAALAIAFVFGPG